MCICVEATEGRPGCQGRLSGLICLGAETQKKGPEEGNSREEMARGQRPRGEDTEVVEDWE